MYKLINNDVYSKAMDNLKSWTEVRLVTNEKEYLKWTSNPSYMSLKIFYKDLVETLKNKVTLTLKKGQVDSPESPEMPEIMEMTENFRKVTKHLTKLNRIFRRFQVF